MKLGILAFCLLSLICKSHAQSFVVSNLDEPATFEFAFAEPARWISTSFATGSQPARLDRLTVELQTYDDDDFIALYSNSSTNSPLNELFRFLNPPEALAEVDRFRFNAPTAGDVNMLAADTTYWLVFGVPSGDYTFGSTLSSSETGQWDIGEFETRRSNDMGLTWPTTLTSYARFRIDATTIPEPSEYAFAIALVMGIFILVRRRRNRMTEF